MNYCNNSYWPWFWPAGFFIILFICVGIGRMFWWRRGSHWSGETRQDALEILKQRYAHSEITESEYKHMKEELRK
jgi:uncharacterized membrane protein